MDEPVQTPPAADFGKPKLNTHAEQLAQATAMLSMRLFDHKTVEEIAEEFGVSRASVTRRLRLARKEGVPEEARNIFIKEMLPAAMAVVQEALRSKDEKIRTTSAWKLIEGLEAMKPPEDEREARKAGASDGDTYEVWRERVRVTKRAVDAAAEQHRTAGGSERQGDIIESSAVRVQDITPDSAAADVSEGGAVPAPVSVPASDGNGS